MIRVYPNYLVVFITVVIPVLPFFYLLFALSTLGVAIKVQRVFPLQKKVLAASANYHGVRWILGFAQCISSQYGITLTVR